VGGRAPETGIILQFEVDAEVRLTDIYDLFSVECMYAVQFMTSKLIQLFLSKFKYLSLDIAHMLDTIIIRGH